MITSIICFSHLRWNFVYQRPQHLLSRFSEAAKVYFIEEPIYDANIEYFNIVKDSDSDVTVITPHLTPGDLETQNIQKLKSFIEDLLPSMEISHFMLWYYSPMALEYSRDLNADLIVYDCMDELSAFKFAPPALRALENELMEKADIVFTGGNSLFKAKRFRHHNIYPFPSSIDKNHFFSARLMTDEPADQIGIPHPRLGYYGVIDERINIELIEQIALQRPAWQIILIGPVVKIDPGSLPQLPNIHYLGMKDYKVLPNYLAGWDIAIMPFAINEATEFISPTKTPEYLCGGKPVISTPIQDVVNPYGEQGLVSIADTPEEFVKAGEEILHAKDRTAWLLSVNEFLAEMSWDKTHKNMERLILETMEKKNIVEQNTKVHV